MGSIPTGGTRKEQDEYFHDRLGFKHSSIEEAVDIYREFYRLDKSAFAKWEKGRPEPSWWEAVDINE